MMVGNVFPLAREAGIGFLFPAILIAAVVA
jgi:hypothetical protein